MNCQKVINVFEDSTYSFKVSTLYNANNIKGYIDFNNDGDFIDANEQIFDLNTTDNFSGNYISTSTINITIPSVNGSTIISGNKLRLRLNSDIGNVANACEAPQRGQVEDYTIIINELVLNLTSDFSASDSTICPGISVSFTNLSTGANAYLWDFGDGTYIYIAKPYSYLCSSWNLRCFFNCKLWTNTITETKTGFITINSKSKY